MTHPVSTSVLQETAMDRDPFRQFQLWFDEAEAAGVPFANAMTLATASADGHPSARMVLLRNLDERGFVFFTHYESPKGAHLAENPRAALVFHWPSVERQVRIEGRVDRVASEESDAYFQSRPRGHQLGAWVGRQSELVASRTMLEQRMNDLVAQHEGQKVPRPPYWGGYRVVPETIEFWLSQPDRLHDRLRYRRTPGGWQMERLSP